MPDTVSRRGTFPNNVDIREQDDGGHAILVEIAGDGVEVSLEGPLPAGTNLIGWSVDHPAMVQVSLEPVFGWYRYIKEIVVGEKCKIEI